MMDYEDPPLSAAACAGGRAATRSLCVQAVGGGLSSLAALISNKSALEKKVKELIAVTGFSSLSYGTSLATTCHPTQVNTPRLSPSQ